VHRASLSRSPGISRASKIFHRSIIWWVIRNTAARDFAAKADLDITTVIDVPYVLIGPTEQIMDQLYAARERWGITRWVLRANAMDDAEHLLAALD
jgi:hypothetical protein